ncbi:hypothetical protein ABZX75_10145 [Streptomyces sp. NPDC003038]|uniref:hypothetical protein n=1 Tax=unclassified Streptomyces TaxID=2593676 RepID=UPI0033AE1AF4
MPDRSSAERAGELTAAWDEMREDVDHEPQAYERLVVECARELAADPGGPLAYSWTLGLVLALPYSDAERALTYTEGEDRAGRMITAAALTWWAGTAESSEEAYDALVQDFEAVLAAGAAAVPGVHGFGRPGLFGPTARAASRAGARRDGGSPRTSRRRPAAVPAWLEGVQPRLSEPPLVTERVSERKGQSAGQTRASPVAHNQKGRLSQQGHNLMREAPLHC